MNFDVVDTMRATDGTITITLSDGEATLRWAEFPIFSSFDEMTGSPQAAEGFGMGAVGSVEKPFGFSVHPLFSERAFDDAATSLRKALDRKRRQTVDGLPNIIVLGLGHHRLEWAWVLPMFAERIWSNAKYKWITALAAYTPERAWDQLNGTAMITFDWNPNSAIPAPQSLRDAVDGRATFHLP